MSNVKYDEKGVLLSVHCSLCDTRLTGSSGERLHHWAWHKVLLTMKHPDGREFTCHPIVCKDCCNKMGPHLGEALWQGMLDGWAAEQKAAVWSQEKSQAYFEGFRGCVPVKVEV